MQQTERIVTVQLTFVGAKGKELPEMTEERKRKLEKALAEDLGADHAAIDKIQDFTMDVKGE